MVSLAWALNPHIPKRPRSLQCSQSRGTELGNPKTVQGISRPHMVLRPRVCTSIMLRFILRYMIYSHDRIWNRKIVLPIIRCRSSPDAPRRPEVCESCAAGRWSGELGVSECTACEAWDPKQLPRALGSRTSNSGLQYYIME